MSRSEKNKKKEKNNWAKRSPKIYRIVSCGFYSIKGKRTIWKGFKRPTVPLSVYMQGKFSKRKMRYEKRYLPSRLYTDKDVPLFTSSFKKVSYINRPFFGVIITKCCGILPISWVSDKIDPFFKNKFWSNSFEIFFAHLTSLWQRFWKNRFSIKENEFQNIDFRLKKSSFRKSVLHKKKLKNRFLN